jgi:DNA-binding transcriptional LysR family regulator
MRRRQHGSAVLDLQELEAFLAVAEERHFGRAAARLRRSQSRISRLVAALERRVGGRLFERTSRRVVPTPLGLRLYETLAPAHARLVAAVDDTRRAAAGLNGQLRIGYHSVSVAGDAFTDLMTAFGARYPDCKITLIEVLPRDLYTPLLQGDIDILVSYPPARPVPDLTVGPSVDSQPRVLAVSADHSLAARRHVSIEEIPEWPCISMPEGARSELFDAVVPPTTPSGRPLNRRVAASSFEETVRLIESGRAVHLTIPHFRAYTLDHLVTYVAVPDMPPLDKVLIWRTGNDNAQVHCFAALATPSRDLAKRP